MSGRNLNRPRRKAPRGAALLAGFGLALLAPGGTALGDWISGSVEFAAGGVVALYSDSDVTELYGEDLSTRGSLKGTGLSVAVGYAFSERLMAGVALEPALAKRLSVRRADGRRDRWDAGATGLLAEGRLAMPDAGRARMALVAAAGWYGLTGSTVTTDGASGSYRLRGSSPGGRVGFALEHPLSPVIWLSGEAGYRVASIGGVRLSGDLGGTPLANEPLRDADGSDARLDLSGLYLRFGLTVVFLL